MSTARIRRADRIVELRALGVDRVEIELGQRVRDTARAEVDAKSARQAWEAAASTTPAAICSSSDLSEAYAYRIALIQRSETLDTRAKQVRAQEDSVREKLRVAKTELRKIETWRDRLVETLRAEESTQERKAADDVAARIARSA